jgi:transcriptional accessory protein Tex/SPT6
VLYLAAERFPRLPEYLIAPCVAIDRRLVDLLLQPDVVIED